MAVNGIELKEGQVWKRYDGVKFRLEPSWDNKTYVWKTVYENGEYDTVDCNGNRWERDTIPFLREIVYNPEEVNTSEENVPKKFDPKPGDKIICNNGEEFICCTKEDIEKNLGFTIYPHEDILGYQSAPLQWQDWNSAGVAEGDDEYEYNIRKVIPKQKEEDMQEFNKEEPKYTVEDIRKAFAALEWEATSYRSLIEALNKIANPEYLEYLRLKAIYE